MTAKLLILKDACVAFFADSKEISLFLLLAVPLAIAVVYWGLRTGRLRFHRVCEAVRRFWYSEMRNFFLFYYLVIGGCALITVVFVSRSFRAALEASRSAHVGDSQTLLQNITNRAPYSAFYAAYFLRKLGSTPTNLPLRIAYFKALKFEGVETDREALQFYCYMAPPIFCRAEGSSRYFAGRESFRLEIDSKYEETKDAAEIKRERRAEDWRRFSSYLQKRFPGAATVKIDDSDYRKVAFKPRPSNRKLRHWANESLYGTLVPMLLMFEGAEQVKVRMEIQLLSKSGVTNIYHRRKQPDWKVRSTLTLLNKEHSFETLRPQRDPTWRRWAHEDQDTLVKMTVSDAVRVIHDSMRKRLSSSPLSLNEEVKAIAKGEFPYESNWWFDESILPTLLSPSAPTNPKQPSP